MVGPRGKILIQLLKRFVDKAMLRAANMTSNPYTGEPKKEGQMPIHVAFYLDEFPAMGVLPDIANNFAMMRSYRVSYHVTLQNLSQGEVLYGRDGFRSFFNNNLQHILFFPSRTKMDDAKYFSDYLGEITVTERRYSDSEQKTIFGGGGSKGESWGDAMRKMLSPGEMLSYPNNEAVLFVIGAPAVKVVMPGYYQEKYNLLEKDPKTGISNVKGKEFRNPIYPMYKALNVHDPRKFLEEILLGMDKDKISPMEQVLNEEEHFQMWANNITEHGANVTIFEDRQKYIIKTQGLPTSLADPDMLSIWADKEWLAVKDEQITLKKAGLRVLGIVLINKIIALRHRGPVMLWLQNHAAELENHPVRTNSTGELPKAAGYYEGEAIIISIEDAKKIWQGILPPDDYSIRKNTVKMYRIPLNDDDFLKAMQDKVLKKHRADKADEEAAQPAAGQGASKPDAAGSQGGKQPPSKNAGTPAAAASTQEKPSASTAAPSKGGGNGNRPQGHPAASPGGTQGGAASKPEDRPAGEMQSANKKVKSWLNGK